MPIPVLCPSCGVKINAPDSAAGKKATCPRCKSLFRIPGANVPDPPAEAVSTVPSWRPVEQDIEEVQEIDFAPRPPAPVRDEYDDEPARGRFLRRSRRRRIVDDDVGFRCPFCNTDAPPITRQKISAAGWIMFILLLLVICLPLCWIGLLMKEDYRVCRDCGMKLG